jgi:hypothetical protein
MQSFKFIEDVYIDFFEKVMMHQVTGHDQRPSFNFYSILANSEPVTKAQSEYIIRLLTKYQPLAIKDNIDYSAELANPRWRHPFRIIDQSKQIHVEKDQDGIPWICLKFPFQLKKEFDEEMEQHQSFNSSFWNPDRKLRFLSLYNFNVVQIYEFAKKHNFIIDNSFLHALSEVEEIWEQEDNIIPVFSIVNDSVVISNVEEETISWWEEHSTGILDNDLLLAKSMGFKFLGTPTTLSEKIASDPGSRFWIEDVQAFLKLCNNLQGKVVIILDRASDARRWVKEFIAEVEQSNFSKSDIRICFRASKDQDSIFNNWVKDNDLGGTVDQGKIFIFDHKPAKWLFKQEQDVKMLVTNNLYPHTHTLTRNWINSHPCVIYLGDIKPTLIKDQNIVKL